MKWKLKHYTSLSGLEVGDMVLYHDDIAGVQIDQAGRLFLRMSDAGKVYPLGYEVLAVVEEVRDGGSC